MLDFIIYLAVKISLSYVDMVTLCLMTNKLDTGHCAYCLIFSSEGYIFSELVVEYVTFREKSS
jgi:hypothetical protein